jgi:hypothetical protein
MRLVPVVRLLVAVNDRLSLQTTSGVDPKATSADLNSPPESGRSCLDRSPMELLRYCCGGHKHVRGIALRAERVG